MAQRRARGTFLPDADGDTFWHVHFPFGPHGSGTSSSLAAAPAMLRTLQPSVQCAHSGSGFKGLVGGLVRILHAASPSTFDLRAVEHVNVGHHGSHSSGSEVALAPHFPLGPRGFTVTGSRLYTATHGHLAQCPLGPGTPPDTLGRFPDSSRRNNRDSDKGVAPTVVWGSPLQPTTSMGG